jgi:hypothetical protein
VAAGDGGLSSLSLGDGECLLQWFSDDEEGTYRGGVPRRSFLGGRFGSGCGVLAWRLELEISGLKLQVFPKLSMSHCYLKVWFNLLMRELESYS